ncbi:MAG: hypothetical protein ISR82_07585 [Candidatus Marinimicrobia bacterium]|nr:hypothetical protein [Candidatus Neomarinimicrobiota bacterium]MBL7011068.1 hypothetical protein [Candidatus Neomarinimicrobiota bacterium]MBL7031106.1 hypothetical protein [Candidatus Neomarinimicrobiota bacterium]
MLLLKLFDKHFACLPMTWLVVYNHGWLSNYTSCRTCRPASTLMKQDIIPINICIFRTTRPERSDEIVKNIYPPETDGSVEIIKKS